MKSKILVLVLFGILLSSVSLSALGTVQKVNVTSDDLNISFPEKKGHPKLESVLYELTQAKDYSEFAQTYGLDVTDNKVSVVLYLTNVEYSLLSEFGIEGSRYENLLQAQVYIDKILELAEDPNIQFIRRPDKAVLFEKGEKDVASKLALNHIYYLSGIGIIIILFLAYYFLKKR